MMNDQFISSKHQLLIAKHLEECAYKPKRLIISMPPRHGKSFLVSQHFPAWFLGKFPEKNVISASYGAELAEGFGRYVRNLMQTPEYEYIFETRVTKDSKAKKRFNTDQGGSYYAVGKGGPITGRGGDIIIVDDLIKSDREARSQIVREGIKDWWKETLFTRLSPGASVVVVATRWHEDDLTGWLLNNSHQDWEHLCLPAISYEGEALWPERYPIGELKQIEKETGLSFEALYQQNPVKPEGEIIKRKDIRYYDHMPEQFDQQIMSWDLTFKGGKENDFVVGQVWGKAGSDFYLIDQVRGKWDFTETIFHFKNMCERHPLAYNRVIEDAANGAALVSQLQKNISGLNLWKPRTDKIGRVTSVTPLFTAGNVHIPQTNLYDWVDAMEKEWFSFPHGKNDDTVDAMTQALINLQEQEAGIIMGLGTRRY